MPEDAEAISAIYNYYVANSSATLQHEIEAAADRSTRILSSGARYPTLVAEDGTGVVGFGALMPFRPREGWLPTVENSVYVQPDRHRQGIGRTLLTELIARATSLGYHSVVAAITGDQVPSLLLHKALGFVPIGTVVGGGEKFGQRFDVVFLQRML